MQTPANNTNTTSSTLPVMTTAEYEAHPGCYRSIWDTERTDWPDWESVRHKYLGRRTLLKEGALWVEGLSFEIRDPAPLEPAVEAACQGIDELQQELKRESDLVGYALHAAASLLCKNWLDAFGNGCGHNLADDVTSLIQRLEIFRAKARAILPIANGGFGGHRKSLLLEKLSLAGIEILTITAEDPAFSFTGCDADEFNSFDEALSAALLAHPEIVADLSQAGATAS